MIQAVVKVSIDLVLWRTFLVYRNENERILQTLTLMVFLCDFVMLTVVQMWKWSFVGRATS